MPRKSLSRSARARIFREHGGRCHICGGLILAVEAWDVEHCTPISMGGADDESNMAPAHRKGCHSEKTKADRADLAKAQSREAKHRGFTAPKRPLQSQGFVPAAKQRRATGKVPKLADMPPSRLARLAASQAEGSHL